MNPHTHEWWRLVRCGSVLSLESISERSLERGLPWAYACDVSTDMLGSDPTPHHVQEAILRAMRAYFEQVQRAVTP